MAEWTPARVGERLRKAVALRSRWAGWAKPNVICTELWSGGEGIGSIGGIGVTVAGVERDVVIAEAAEALSWLRWLDPEDAGIVVARLEGARWKAICWRFGISRPTADRRFRYALAVIAWQLNGDRSPSSPSMRSFLGQRSGRDGRETFLGGTGSGTCG
jgi:hypothetical protein